MRAKGWAPMLPMVTGWVEAEVLVTRTGVEKVMVAGVTVRFGLAAWPVPVDDTNTMRFTLYSIETTDAAKIEQLRVKYDLSYNPTDHAAALFRGDVRKAAITLATPL